MDEKQMKEKLKGMLSKERYRHSKGVAETAVQLAALWGADEEKAYIAGLLHDCAKNIPAAESVELCRRLGVELGELELAAPSIIHAPLGAELIKRDFGIFDGEISDAIRYHTVARSGMTRLDDIIYLADMIEPLRDFAGVGELRDLSGRDLDKAMAAAFKESLTHNIKKDIPVHPNTLIAWNERIMKMGKKGQNGYSKFDKNSRQGSGR